MSQQTIEFLERKSDTETLAPVLEVNEQQSVLFDRPTEEGEFEEISPRIFSLKDVKEPLTLPSLNNAIYELGVINLCWPEISEPVFETRTCFPPSYYTNSTKERLLLAYAENFRRQYNFHYKFKRPLLFQAPNECGLQKMVCTTIRPTKICYTGTNTWQGVASLVSDFFDYEPLAKPMLLGVGEFREPLELRTQPGVQPVVRPPRRVPQALMGRLAEKLRILVEHKVIAKVEHPRSFPERIMSPYTALIRRKANPFELAHVAVSWLIGAGYDAYVVVGCAVRDVCMAIRYRTVCPELPDENPKVEEPPPPDEEPRYRLVPLPDLTSKYLMRLEEKERAKQQAEIDKIEQERLAKIAELEMPPPDDINDWRTHAWVLVLPGFKDVEDPFFIEPSDGTGHPLDAPQYRGLDSVYNHENYYVNLQDCKEGLGTLNYDLCDLSCWEHLLAGEPTYRRVLTGVDQDDPRTAVDTEKHLDMPPSWVEKLDLSPDEFERRYPGSHKVIHYKKVLLEKFAPYFERDGLVKRIMVHEDYALTKPLINYEWFKHRVDLMEFVKIDYVKKVTYEKFDVGRKDHLIRHEYSFDAPPTSIEAHRTMEFNYYARLDHLTKIICTPLTFEEYYTNRADRLESRVTSYTEGTKAQPKRQLKTVMDEYARNHSVPAEQDIWRRIFQVPDNTIELLYHYAYNFVTNNTRKYLKPNLAETAGKILFVPDKTSGYIADPIAKPLRPLNVYMTLCDNMEYENKARKGIRDREADVITYMQHRNKELTEPELVVALFDTERNDVARKGWMEREAIKAEVSEREKEAEIDPLAPYLARMFGSGHGSGDPLTIKEATIIRDQCINDFKAKQLQRQLLVHERFEKLNTEYKNKRLWYLANQYILTPEKEAKFFEVSAELAFQLHTLEVRLTRHMDLSAPRYKALMDYLDKHPLLKEFNRVKHHYGIK